MGYTGHPGRRPVAVLPLVCLAVTAGAWAGCGGDDDAGREATGPGVATVEEGDRTTGAEAEQAPADLTRAEYIERADEMCRQAQRRAARLLVGLEPDAPDERMQSILAQMLRESRALLDDLRQLPVPEGDEETLAELYEANEEEIAQAERNLESDPESAFADPGASRAAELAREYGMEACASEEVTLEDLE